MQKGKMQNGKSKRKNKWRRLKRRSQKSDEDAAAEDDAANANGEHSPPPSPDASRQPSWFDELQKYHDAGVPVPTAEVGDAITGPDTPLSFCDALLRRIIHFRSPMVLTHEFPRVERSITVRESTLEEKEKLAREDDAARDGGGGKRRRLPSPTPRTDATAASGSKTKTKTKKPNAAAAVSLVEDGDLDALLDAEEGGGGLGETERERLIRTGVITTFAAMNGFERRVKVKRTTDAAAAALGAWKRGRSASKLLTGDAVPKQYPAARPFNASNRRDAAGGGGGPTRAQVREVATRDAALPLRERGDEAREAGIRRGDVQQRLVPGDGRRDVHSERDERAELVHALVRHFRLLRGNTPKAMLLE